MKSHPTALIDQSSTISDDVVIGPYAIIGSNVTIGHGVTIGAHVNIEQNVIIGNNVCIHAGAILGADPQDRLYTGGETWLEIGDDSVIREYAVIARGSNEKTIISQRVLIMAHTHIGHDCQIGTGSVISNNVTLLDNVQMGDYSMAGANSFVNRNCRIGKLSFVGGGARLHLDVPPFVTAGDEPLQITDINKVALEKHGYSPEDISVIREAYILINSRHDSVSSLANQLSQKYTDNFSIAEVVDFINGSARGII